MIAEIRLNVQEQDGTGTKNRAIALESRGNWLTANEDQIPDDTGDMADATPRENQAETLGNCSCA
jgi:hypothetical protein